MRQSQELSRRLHDPNAVFIRADFASVDEAKTFRQRLIESGALDRSDVSIKVQPTVVEEEEATSY